MNNAMRPINNMPIWNYCCKNEASMVGRVSTFKSLRGDAVSIDMRREDEVKMRLFDKDGVVRHQMRGPSVYMCGTFAWVTPLKKECQWPDTFDYVIISP